MPGRAAARRTLVDSGMQMNGGSGTRALKGEPRWPALVALLAIGGLYWTLPERLTPGPSWLILVGLAALLVPTMLAHLAGKVRLNFALGVALLGIITAA